MSRIRPTLAMMLAAAAALSAIANAVDAASPPPEEKTRLGVALEGSVSQRDQAASQRGRQLGLREQAAKAVEERLKAQLDASRPAKPASGAGGGTAGAAVPEDQYAGLARIYQAMKPGAAAIVLEQLDMDVQMKIAKNMRERSTALILAKMDPLKAAALSMGLARGRVPPAMKPTATTTAARP